MGIFHDVHVRRPAARTGRDDAGCRAPRTKEEKEKGAHGPPPPMLSERTPEQRASPLLCSGTSEIRRR